MKEKYLLKGMYTDVVEVQKIKEEYKMKFIRDEKYSFPLCSSDSEKYNQDISITEKEYNDICNDGILLA